MARSISSVSTGVKLVQFSGVNAGRWWRRQAKHRSLFAKALWGFRSLLVRDGQSERFLLTRLELAEAGDHELVAVAQEGQGAIKLGTSRVRASGFLLLKDFFDSGGFELVEQGLQVLPGGRHAGISDLHASSVLGNTRQRRRTRPETQAFEGGGDANRCSGNRGLWYGTSAPRQLLGFKCHRQIAARRSGPLSGNILDKHY